MGKTKKKETSSSKREEKALKEHSKVKDNALTKKTDKSAEKKAKKKAKKKDKEKKDKKDKRKKKSRKVDSSPITSPVSTSVPSAAPDQDSNLPSDKPSSAGWNNWSAAQFESEDRKNKFLRFMGIKKSSEKDTGENSAVSTKNASQFDSAISKDYATMIQTDLEKQFNAGLAMRQQTQRGARGGLGF
ncbi:hypothetical protein IWW48_005914 [Coemansia sp. RSA 1200]|nr:hypothetical protein IWW48_005914 [Coemansia sp. RSA 1200]